MAYVDSSLEQPLPKAVAPSAEPSEADDQAPDQEEEEEARRPRERKAAATLKSRLIDQIDDINLARYLDQQHLDEIGMLCVDEYRIDELSREDWLATTRAAMDMALQKTTPRTFPWAGASNTVYPVISQAALEFQARAYAAIVQSRNVVKGTVWGSDKGTPVTEDGKPDGKPRMQPLPPGAPPGTPQQPMWLIAPGEKRKRADRIGEHMSWQLLDEMPEWEPQTDQMLMQIPVTGGAVRKSFYDPQARRNSSLFVSLANIIWNYHAPSFEAAPRHTEKILKYPHEITTLERIEADDDGDNGMWLPLNYGVGGGVDGTSFGFDEKLEEGQTADDDAPHLFIEQHRRLDLDDDGYEEPYIVTTHLRSSKVVRIVARYDEEDVEAAPDSDNTIVQVRPVEHYTLYPFFPNIDGGSYPMGFGHLLKHLNGTINTALNQMFDAATLQNAGGGFISDQLGAPSGQTLFQVGKFVRVNSKGGAIRDAVLPLDFKGPSPTLFQLLGVLVSASEKLASVGNVLAGDAAIANAPPTTILALIEQGMKVYTGIHKRIYRAEKSELDKLYRLNRKHIKDKARYQVGDEFREITAEDYRLGGGVVPIADPTMTTDMQKLGRAQILMGFNGDPLINQLEIRRRLFEAANLDRIDELFVQPDPAAQQMQMAIQQAQLGKVRAEELDHQTHAFLNMALARKNASAQEEAQLDAQLTFMRLRIEGLNSLIKAAGIDHAFHDTNTRAAVDHARNIAATAPDPGAPTPAPEGTLPLATAEPPAGPAVNKPTPGGLPADIGATPPPEAPGA